MNSRMNLKMPREMLPFYRNFQQYKKKDKQTKIRKAISSQISTSKIIKANLETVYKFNLITPKKKNYNYTIFTTKLIPIGAKSKTKSKN